MYKDDLEAALQRANAAEAEVKRLTSPKKARKPLKPWSWIKKYRGYLISIFVLFFFTNFVCCLIHSCIDENKRTDRLCKKECGKNDEVIESSIHNALMGLPKGFSKLYCKCYDKNKNQLYDTEKLIRDKDNK